jgi:hypothetical protein
LKKEYDDARRSRSKLHIVFINSEVTSSAPNSFDKDWNFSGSWQGRFNTGWPGGANVKGLAPAKPKASVPEAASALPPVNPSDGNVRGDITTGDPPVDDKWTSVTSYATPAHRTMKRPQGSLKKKTGEEAGGESKESRKTVKFLPRNEEKFYEPKSKATEHVVRASQLPDDEKYLVEGSFASRSPEEAFIDAVQNRICRDLIQVLE